jgi:hypothetical protein
VLDLEGCDISDIGYVGNLLHLRYLELRYHGIYELPMEIGNLQLLQTMDISGTNIKELPSSVVWLKSLMCLCIHEYMKLPSQISNLTSLEVLVGAAVAGNFNHHLVKELGHLTKLRLLQFTCKKDLDESMCKALVESLNKLHKLEILDVYVDNEYVDLMSEGWVPPQQLRRFSSMAICSSFLALPAWVNPYSLHVLSCLRISLHEVTLQAIQIVGMLPALRYLELWGPYKVSGVEVFVVTPDSFPCATECLFNLIPAVPSVFPRGAAPRLRKLQFSYPAMWISRGDDLGMGHLPSLENVEVQLYPCGATDAEVTEAYAALRAAADDHPNRPSLEISKDFYNWSKSESDDEIY